MKFMGWTVERINILRESKGNHRIKVMYKCFLIDTYEPDATLYNMVYCQP